MATRTKKLLRRKRFDDFVLRGNGKHSLNNKTLQEVLIKI